MDSADITALAILAGAAYDAAPVGVVIDAGDDIRAVLTERNGAIVVAVRGTVPTDLDNWMTDFDALPCRMAGIGLVPRGFCNAAANLFAALRPHIAGRRVVLTGHSLGGALAILTCAQLRADRTPAEYTAAFEPPRTCGWFSRWALHDQPGIVTHYGNDPVPDVPPLYSHPWPVTRIGADCRDPIAAHSIQGVITWLQQHPLTVSATP